MKCGAFSGPAELMKVFQSPRVLGEKIFVPEGQLLDCVAFLTSMHCSHFMSLPGEYDPVRSTSLHLHELGLFPPGFKLILVSWQ
jgi:hypothetical protein